MPAWRFQVAALDAGACTWALEKLAATGVLLPGQMGSVADMCGECCLRRELVVNAVSEFIASFRPSRNRSITRRRLRQREDIEGWMNGADALMKFADCAAAFAMPVEALRARILSLAGAAPAQHHRFFGGRNQQTLHDL